jgi:hypothetical protein
MSFDLDADQIRELLDELDRRLRADGIAATVYLVGGAAVALQLPDADRRTQDIDGLTTNDKVAGVVSAMAAELGLPENWLNGAAAPYVPAPPRGAMDPPASAGLHVELAPLRHLLAMKLAAGRARDRADITAIAAALGIDADTAVQLTLETYGSDALEVFTNAEDVRLEADAAIPQRGARRR